MNMAIVIGLLYIVLMPILVRVFAIVQRKMVERKARKLKQKKKDTSNLSQPIWPKMRQRIMFAFKDSRSFSLKSGKPGTGPIQNRFVLFAVYVAGLVVAVMGAITAHYEIMLLGFLLFFVALGFALIRSHDAIKARNLVIDRMFELAVQRLGQSRKYEGNPLSVVKVMQWREYTKPQKVRFSVPTSFSAEGEEGFLRHYNQVFGQDVSWVPDNDLANGKLGWDYDQGTVTLRSVPPLPLKADWEEQYVLNPAIAWSFFPIAKGVSDGVEVTNQNTGEQEFLLGFDVSGDQAKVGKQHDVPVSQKIAMTPQVFIGGSTGGGKALDVDTPVWVEDCDES